MTCSISSAASTAITLRAKAEAIYQAHAAAVSRGDAAKGKALWTAYRDADQTAYEAEREALYLELCDRYPVVD